MKDINELNISDLEKMSDDELLNVLKETSDKYGDSIVFTETLETVIDILEERHGDEKAQEVVKAAFVKFGWDE
jgi:predicted esterase YcpF (UPF0227 family)